MTLWLDKSAEFNFQIAKQSFEITFLFSLWLLANVSDRETENLAKCICSNNLRMNECVCDQICRDIADALEAQSNRHLTRALIICDGIDWDTLCSKQRKHLCYRKSLMSSLPSFQVHQRVLFLQPFLGAPIQNIHSLYYSLLTLKSVEVLKTARHQTHTQSHLPQRSDCPPRPCRSLWRGAEVHKRVKSSHQSLTNTLESSCKGERSLKVWIIVEKLIWTPKWLQNTEPTLL